jgi:predicted phosphate transport protein (TIGR00153 family)
MKAALRDEVGRGVRITIGRQNFLYMISLQDRIADYAQNVAEQLSFRELYENQEARDNLVKMAEAVVATVRRYEDTVEQLKNLSQSGFTAKEKRNLHRLIREVNRLEHEADEVERDSAAFVFSEGEDEPLAAMHMYRVLQRLDDVANACEKAANAFLPIVLG